MRPRPIRPAVSSHHLGPRLATNWRRIFVIPKVAINSVHMECNRCHSRSFTVAPLCFVVLLDLFLPFGIGAVARSKPVRRLRIGRVELETPLSIKSARFFGLGLLSGRFLGRSLFSIRGGCGAGVGMPGFGVDPGQGNSSKCCGTKLSFDTRSDLLVGQQASESPGECWLRDNRRTTVVRDLRIRKKGYHSLTLSMLTRFKCWG
ncbi:uncharacterized protein B0H64DRAFT_168664 [Chaetomium fimeti]|uniref:Uncharacterized protein n=1 Tax=Chaetomium fimeti TaxID=1854472 RepID=A0AAE0LSX5_9PEZI|nr:hypothetical protein B0H64DRAFT_168664 [Chaetomium fimeti]